ncbi:MAG TPA: NUDIX domain-containing protein, partial [Planctomycetota bacterium]|nr:NUDIX domain-containing protein [Planctomycetota bacterium]
TQRLDLQGLWVVREGRVVLMQRPEGGAMAGMWELPTRRSEESLPSTLWSAAWPAGLRPRLGAPLMEAQHAITHHRIRIQVLEARVAARIPSPAYEWDFANLEGLPLTGITKKVLAQLGRP